MIRKRFSILLSLTILPIGFIILAGQFLVANAELLNSSVAIQPVGLESRSILPEQTITYTHALSHTSNTTETIQVSLVSESGAELSAMLVSPPTMTVAPSTTMPITLTVMAPMGAISGTQEVVTVTATLSGSVATAVNTTTVGLLSAPLTVVPIQDSATGLLGETITYTHVVTNNSNMSDTVQLTVSDEAFIGSLSANELLLPPFASDTFTLSVSLPASATAETATTHTISLTSSLNGVPATYVTDTTTIAQQLNPLTVTPLQDSRSGAPGETIAFSHMVTNNSNVTDTVDLLVSDEPVAGMLSTNRLSLAPFEATPFTLTVAIPADAPVGLLVTHLVTATSSFTELVPVVVTDTTSVDEQLAVTVTVQQTDNSGGNEPSDTKEYRYTVTNAGNSTRSISLDFDYTAGIDPQPRPPASTTLMAGEQVSYTFSFEVPSAPQGSIYTTSLTASTGSVSHTASTTMTVGQEAGVLLTPSSVAGAGDPGQVVTYSLTVLNAGNFSDTYDLAVTADYEAVVMPTSLNLDSGANGIVEVWVTVSDEALAEESDTAVLTVSSRSDNSVSDTAIITTTAQLVPAVVVTPTASSQTGAPGESVLYTHQISNQSNGDLPLQLAIMGNAYPTELSETALLIPHQGEASIMVTVTIPTTAVEGNSDAVTITLSNNGNTLETVVNETSVKKRRLYLPIIFKPKDPPTPAQWEKLDNLFQERSLDIAICSHDSTSGLVATNVGLGLIENNQISLVEQVLPSGNGSLVSSVVLDEDCETAYIGYYSDGIWMGELNESNWSWTLIGEPSQFVDLWTLDYEQNILLAGGGFGIGYKQDQSDWQIITGNKERPVTKLTIEAEFVYAVQFGFGKPLYASVSDLSKWSFVSSINSTDNKKLRSIVLVESNLYVGGENAYYRLVDDQWQIVEQIGVYAMTNQNGTFYAGHWSSDGVSQIDMANGNAKRINQGWEAQTPDKIYALLAIKNSIRDQIYAATSDGVWVYGRVDE